MPWDDASYWHSPGQQPATKSVCTWTTHPVIPPPKDYMERVSSDDMISVVYKTTWVGERRRQALKNDVLQMYASFSTL